MTTYKEQQTNAPARKLTLAEILEIFAAGQQNPLKFTA
jgi:cyclopropane-fatty-acyl-phospholipid synthase